MKYRINPFPMLRPYDLLVIYRKNSQWHLSSFTCGYKLLKRDRIQLLETICKQKRIKPEDVKFVKCKELIGEDLP